MADDLLTRAAEGLRDPIGLQCAGMREDLRAHTADLLGAVDKLGYAMGATKAETLAMTDAWYAARALAAALLSAADVAERANG